MRRQKREKHESNVYVEQKDGKFVKLSDLEKPASSKANSKSSNRKDK
jgi:hypothetical protein